MSFYSFDPESDKITKVKGEGNWVGWWLGSVLMSHVVVKAKSVMMENIDKVIQRGESIEVLVDKVLQFPLSCFPSLSG